MGNFLRKGSFIDLDYVYGTLTNAGGEYPLDFAAVRNNPMELLVVATEAETGRCKYFTKDDIRLDDCSVCKASSAIPTVCKPYVIDGVPYFDGALADPVPVQKAFDMGCDRVVVLLTKPKDLVRLPGNDPRLARGIQKKYPLAAEKMRHRADLYNESVALAKQHAAQGKALIVAPDDTCGVSTLTRDPEKLKQLYHKGYADGRLITEFLATHP